MRITGSARKALDMKRTSISIIVIALLVALSGGGGVIISRDHHVALAAPAPTCGPMDVAFIIDDTGSMGGALTNVKAELTGILDDIQTASGNDYRLALVTVTDSSGGNAVFIRENFSLTNRASVATEIQNLTAGGGGNEPESTDEALNTVVNALPAAGRGPCQNPLRAQCQNVNFTPAFRTGALKIVILITDAGPGGFDDPPAVRPQDIARAHGFAIQAGAQGIKISAVYVPDGATPVAQTRPVMQDYASTTGGAFTETGSDGTGTGNAIRGIIASCGGPSCGITCPANITKSNDSGQCGAVTSYTLPSSPNCTVTCSPSPGSFFPVGATNVTCNATPASLSPGLAPSASPTCSFTVTVRDTQAPSIACPTNVNIQCTGGSGPKYTLPSVTDNCPGATIVCFPPPNFNFGPGTTSVNCEAMDQGENSARCTFTVTVGDTTPPTITGCPGTVPIQNLQQACDVPIDVTALVSATDNCTPAGSLTKSQIPPAGTRLAAGTTQTVTVVVRDAAGNQSSCPVMVTIAAGPPAAVKITPETVDLGSIKLFAAKKKNKVKPTSTQATFTIENTGCPPLTVSPRAITRVTDGGRMNADDSMFFTVTLANGQPFTSVSLVKGEAPMQLKVTFNPSVPRLSTCGSSAPSSSCLSASNVLPSSFQTVMSFNGTDKTVAFTAGAAKGVKLIDSANPSATNGVAQLCRSGDQFTVTYFIYDSDTSDVKTVKYEFLDSSGNTVKVLDNIDLAGPVSKAGLVNGMSFKVSQTFSGANDNDNVTKVRVTLTGVGGSSSTAESSGSSGCSASTQAFSERELTTVLLPARRFHAVEP